MAETKKSSAKVVMGPEQFREWRRSLGLKQKEAADRLGLKKRMIQYYEKGDRDGRPVEIPKSVRLACYALANGISDFDGTCIARTEIEDQHAPSSSPDQARGTVD
ncbi:helix-turn-helix domain-containing protein [Polymorphum gilvum]|uniref:Transcriptional Regulator, XRE family protein n=1 Tax=Polymorphum gilvum (strain LMG 25793 / CGMCC 1.9160 / SL003B-26A1) TaxID=991905 RepID=F2J0M1_POLGS|nr:helix-turn-helix transcriptional regulator [Polymorphum gilvum]ADZ69689.1 Transcriptional Regulator, XRE family protein [Polymorphum gilvum SL003B-26A1]